MDKQTLRQYRYLTKEIERLEADKEQLAAGMLGAIRISDLPHGSGTSDPTADLAVRLAELACEMSLRLNQAISLRQEIEAAIATLEPSDRLLMRLRYIDGYTWEQVAVELGYTYQWVCVLHGKILQKIVVVDSN